MGCPAKLRLAGAHVVVSTALHPVRGVRRAWPHSHAAELSVGGMCARSVADRSGPRIANPRYNLITVQYGVLEIGVWASPASISYPA